MRKRLSLIGLVVCLLSTHAVFGVYAVELRIEKTFTQTDELASDTVLTIFEDSHGDMWFGTPHGLKIYDGERFQTFTILDGLPSDSIGLIFEDRHGMLWFGTGVLMITEGILVMGNGVSRYDGHEFWTFTKADDLAGNTVMDIFEDEMGDLWFATMDSSKGVSRYNGERFDNITMNGPMSIEVFPEWWNEIMAIAQDTAGNFWFGSVAGLSYYNPETSRIRYFAMDGVLKSFEEMGQDNPGHVNALQFDANGYLWIGGSGIYEEDSGIRRYDGEALVSFPRNKERPMNDIRSILRDSRGNLWFTGVKRKPPWHDIGAGVSVYNGETFQHFDRADGLPSNRVWSVFEDSKGNLWFATDAGVAVGVYLPFQHEDRGN